NLAKPRSEESIDTRKTFGVAFIQCRGCAKPALRRNKVFSTRKLVRLDRIKLDIRSILQQIAHEVFAFLRVERAVREHHDTTGFDQFEAALQQTALQAGKLGDVVRGFCPY